MAFAQGNQIAAKDKRFRAALEAALERCETRAEGLKAIDEIAMALVEACTSEVLMNDAPAVWLSSVKELRDTLDGKPHQSVGGENGPLEIIIRDLNKEDGDR